ncbi:hypothetical protein FRC04_007461 [Tulasnella sp. 424]|nr:hypothetical protein FRC04_007461 [Tulasnella sp. 424]
MSPRISWFSDVDSNSIELDALWRFSVRRRTEARRASGGSPYLALITAVHYSIKPEEPAILSPSHSSGLSPNLYVYFSPQNEYIAARWSFQPEPPTEAEAAEEASLLSSVPCPKFSSKPESWMTEYLQFEDVKKEDEEEEEDEYYGEEEEDEYYGEEEEDEYYGEDGETPPWEA